VTNQLFKPEDRARLAKVAATELSSLCMDVEVYPNFAMIGLLLREPPQDRVLVFSSEPGLGEAFEAFRRWYAEHGSAYRWVGFNSLGYDNHIVARILEGVDDPAELYTLSGALVNNNTWWRSTRDTAAASCRLILLL
jgi:hypothetical protein